MKKKKKRREKTMTATTKKKTLKRPSLLDAHLNLRLGLTESKKQCRGKNVQMQL
jgi:hypothetical protein